jgi:GLPGLI family protein
VKAQDSKSDFSAIYQFSWAIDSSKSSFRSDEYSLIKTSENTYFYNDAYNYNDSIKNTLGYGGKLSPEMEVKALKDLSNGKISNLFRSVRSDLVVFSDKVKNKQFIRYRDINIPMYYSSEVKTSDWNILSNETETMMGVTVIKATTTYGGRDYIAWFAPQIPIKEGPYVFKNLPGLILKVHDVDKNFEFQLLKYDTKEKEISVYGGIDGLNMEIGYKEWVKVREESYYNPKMRFVPIENRENFKKNNLKRTYFLIER